MTTAHRTRPKEFRFPLDVHWVGDRKVEATVEGKAPLEVAPPPVFRGTEPDVWSPEDLLVAAAASCLAVTFTGLAQREGLAFDALDIAASGLAGPRDDGRFGFTRVEIELTVSVAAEDAAAAAEIAARAEATCLVSASLALPSRCPCASGVCRLLRGPRAGVRRPSARARRTAIRAPGLGLRLGEHQGDRSRDELTARAGARGRRNRRRAPPRPRHVPRERLARRRRRGHVDRRPYSPSQCPTTGSTSSSRSA